MHHDLFSQSPKIMSSTLERDMYDFVELGIPIDQIEKPDPDPLATARYLCVYWIDHLSVWNPTSTARYDNVLQDGGVVDVFLRDKFWYWLEALSLCKRVAKGIVSVGKLWSLIQVCSA
jgi:hypothetical protein